MKLSRKAERALAEYLRSVLVAPGLRVYEGHERQNENQSNPDTECFQLPALIVYAENAQPFEDAPVQIRSVRARFQLQVDSTQNDRAFVDETKRAIHDAIFDIAAVQSALNKPATGSDLRTVKGIHFHDLLEASEPSDVQASDWLEEIQSDVIVEELSA
jgi:hypothetical protein